MPPAPNEFEEPGAIVPLLSEISDNDGRQTVVIAPQTSFAKTADVRQGGVYAPKWFIIDAQGMIVGRLATQ